MENRSTVEMEELRRQEDGENMGTGTCPACEKCALEPECPVCDRGSARSECPACEKCALEPECPVCDRSAVEQGCPSCRTKHRDDKEYRDLMNRLKRIEGQVRGLQGMVEDERYCVEILTQVMAVQSALNGFNKALLSNHIKTCVVQDILDGNHSAVDELCSTIQKLMK